MGNDHSTADQMKSRRSLDANFLRQVNSSQSSPRSSVSVSHPSGLPHPETVARKLSESVRKPPETVGISAAGSAPKLSTGSAHSEERDDAPKEIGQSATGTTTTSLQHRLSTDCAELKYFKPKLSLTGREEMGNQQGRRLSRAAVHLENGGAAGASLAEGLKLTSYQIQLLQSTWGRLKTNSNTFAQVFKLLCFKSTVCREMFQKMSIVEGFRSNQCCDMNMHARVLLELLDSLMGDMTQSSKIVQARCMDIGASHVNMNERCCGSLFDQLGECLTEVITKVECVRSKREAVKAWIILISYLVDGMKCGYMDEWKRKQSGRLAGENGH